MNRKNIVISLTVLVLVVAAVVLLVPYDSGMQSSACNGSYGYGYSGPQPKRCQPVRKTPLIFKLLNIN